MPPSPSVVKKLWGVGATYSEYLLCARTRSGPPGAHNTFRNSFLILGIVLFPVLLAWALPQSEQDRSFKQAVQDYNNNRFTDAQAEFEQIKGTHAQGSATIYRQDQSILSCQGYRRRNHAP